jgi:hypothetical protein
LRITKRVVLHPDAEVEIPKELAPEKIVYGQGD